jgi:hypothetical protein
MTSRDEERRSPGYAEFDPALRPPQKAKRRTLAGTVSCSEPYFFLADLHRTVRSRKGSGEMQRLTIDASSVRVMARLREALLEFDPEVTAMGLGRYQVSVDLRDSNQRISGILDALGQLAVDRDGRSALAHRRPHLRQ